MRIIAPKNRKFDEVIRSISYNVLYSEGEKIVYEGIFGFKIDAGMLNMGVREFCKFVDEIVVEGGKKKRVGSFVIVEPKRTRELAVRLSADEYDALRRMAKAEGRTCEDLFRELALESVARRRWM
ncbi:ribbon-helix-helix protein, CopG family [Thermofilum sp.]|uniref:ribbon-helix-helix protein, CopG family n=1 Tax=Thermofilum sp. TaxID=1961369 RepID=UPI003163AC69